MPQMGGKDLKLTTMSVRHLLGTLGLFGVIVDALWTHAYSEQCLMVVFATVYSTSPHHLPTCHPTVPIAMCIADLTIAHLKRI